MACVPRCAWLPSIGLQLTSPPLDGAASSHPYPPPPLRDCRRAFETFDAFEELGVTPDADTYNALMQASLPVCASPGSAAQRGCRLHLNTPRIARSTACSTMRCRRCGPPGPSAFARAPCVWHRVSVAASWRMGLPTAPPQHALLQGCIECGRVDTALRVFEQLQEAGVEPNSFTHHQLVNASIVLGGCWACPAASVLANPVGGHGTTRCC